MFSFGEIDRKSLSSNCYLFYIEYMLKSKSSKIKQGLENER